MLEGCVLNNTVIGGLTEELQFVLSVAIQHIDYYNNSINKKDGKHRYDDDEECLEITVWALKFYIIENIHDNQLPSGFVNTTIQSLLPDLKVVGIVGGTSTRTTTTTPVNYTLHSSLMKVTILLLLLYVLHFCKQSNFMNKETDENSVITLYNGVCVWMCVSTKSHCIQYAK